MMTRRLWLAVPMVAVLLFILAHQVALRPASAGFFVMVQVNPSVELEIGQDRQVLSVKGIDEAGRAVIATLNLESIRDRPMEEALSALTDHLIAEDKVVSGGQVVVTVRAVGDGRAPAQDLSRQARMVIAGRLGVAGIHADTIGLVVDDKLFRKAAELGFLPADYRELLVLDLSNETLLGILAVPGDQGIARQAFIEAIGALAAAVGDLMRTGVAEDQALAVIRSAVGADPTLEQVREVVGVIIQLTSDQGLTHEAALAKVQAALAADATLGELEEILDLDGDERGNADEERVSVEDDLDEEEPDNRARPDQQGGEGTPEKPGEPPEGEEEEGGGGG